ncbi:MAG: ABC transporter permease [Halanaeroarchaeum sp.]
MRNRRRLARRELASLRSEKTIVLAILIQLFIAAFSSFLVVGMVSLYDPGAAAGEYDVDVAVTGSAADQLLATVERRDALSGRRYPNRGRAMEAFRTGSVSAVLVATETGSGRHDVAATVPRGDFRTTLIVVQIKKALSVLEHERRMEMADRIDVRVLPIPETPPANPYFGFSYTVLVPLLTFLPPFISGSIAADSLAEEIERETLELLRVAPLGRETILDGKALALVAIVPAQSGVWLALLSINGIAISNPVAILLLATGVAIALVGLGAGLAIATGVRREAQLLYSLMAIGVFGFAMFLPESPPNLVAKLALGSQTATSWTTLGVLSVGGVAIYWGIRRTVSMD